MTDNAPCSMLNCFFHLSFYVTLKQSQLLKPCFWLKPILQRKLSVYYAEQVRHETKNVYRSSCNFFFLKFEPESEHVNKFK